MAELFASLPRQIYCHVDRRFLSAGLEEGLIECMWLGLTSVPGRAWGLTVLLESGALYSNVPPHALYFPVPGGDFSRTAWSLRQSQRWDCFGYRFALHEYDVLFERPIVAFVLEERMAGRYLFTAQHFEDGYSLTPEQAKQYHFAQLANGRLCALPANFMLFSEPSFTDVKERPAWLRVQTAIYSCEPKP